MELQFNVYIRRIMITCISAGTTVRFPLRARKMAKEPPAHPRSNEPCGYSFSRAAHSNLQITPSVLFQKNFGQRNQQTMDNLRMLHIFMAPLRQ